MKTIKCKFYCNAGYTEEIVDVEVYENDEEDSIEEQIHQVFLMWLDQNEDCGYEIFNSQSDIDDEI